MCVPQAKGHIVSPTRRETRRLFPHPPLTRQAAPQMGSPAAPRLHGCRRPHWDRRASTAAGVPCLGRSPRPLRLAHWARPPRARPDGPTLLHALVGHEFAKPARAAGRLLRTARRCSTRLNPRLAGSVQDEFSAASDNGVLVETGRCPPLPSPSGTPGPARASPAVSWPLEGQTLAGRGRNGQRRERVRSPPAAPR